MFSSIVFGQVVQHIMDILWITLEKHPRKHGEKYFLNVITNLSQAWPNILMRVLDLHLSVTPLKQLNTMLAQYVVQN